MPQIVDKDMDPYSIAVELGQASKFISGIFPNYIISPISESDLA